MAIQLVGNMNAGLYRDPGTVLLWANLPKLDSMMRAEGNLGTCARCNSPFDMRGARDPRVCNPCMAGMSSPEFMRGVEVRRDYNIADDSIEQRVGIAGATLDRWRTTLNMPPRTPPKPGEKPADLYDEMIGEEIMRSLVIGSPPRVDVVASRIGAPSGMVRALAERMQRDFEQTIMYGSDANTWGKETDKERRERERDKVAYMQALFRVPPGGGVVVRDPKDIVPLPPAKPKKKPAGPPKHWARREVDLD